MKCTNCGAEYDDSALKCPYCQYENSELALQKYNDEVNHLYRERKQIKNLPGIVASRAGKKVMLITLGVIVAIVALIVATNVNSQRVKRRDDTFYYQQVEIMDQMMRDGEYDKLSEHFNSLDYHSDYYHKFYEIKQVYYQYERLVELAEYYNQYKSDYWIESSIQAICRAHSDVADFLNDEHRYNNNEHLKKILADCDEIFIKTFEVTDEEFEEIIQGLSEEQIAEWVDKILERQQ